MATQEAIVRLAGPADYAGILAIDDNVYQGFDYIPTMLRQFLHAPSSYLVYIAVVNGRTVGSLIFAIIEDTDMAVAMSGRIHKDFESKGYLHDIRKKAYADLRAAGVKQIVADALYASFWKKNWPRMEKTMNYVEIYRSRVLFYKSPSRLLDKYAMDIGERYPKAVSDVTTLSYSAAMQMLSDTSVLHDVMRLDGDFFQHGPHWFPAPISTQSIRAALSQDRALITWEEGSNHSALIAMSFCRIIPVKFGNKIDISYYGRGSETFLAHVAKHFEAATKRSNTKLMGVVLHFPLILDSQRIIEELSAGLGPRVVMYPQDDSTEKFIYVRPIPK